MGMKSNHQEAERIYEYRLWSWANTRIVCHLIPGLLLCLTLLFYSITINAKNEISFADWKLQCEEPKDVTEDSCILTQEVSRISDGLPIFKFTVYYSREKQKPVAILILPLGILLPQGVLLEIKKNKPIHLAIRRCSFGGCRTRITLEGKLLKILKSGNTLRVTYYEQKLKPITLELSLMGFTAGLKALMINVSKEVHKSGSVSRQKE